MGLSGGNGIRQNRITCRKEQTASSRLNNFFSLL